MICEIKGFASKILKMGEKSVKLQHSKSVRGDRPDVSHSPIPAIINKLCTTDIQSTTIARC